MTWKEYCECLKIFSESFGNPTKGQIDQGFLYWRSRQKSELVKHILTDKIPDLTHFNRPPEPIKTMIYKHESYKLSDDGLDNFLKQNGSVTLKDAFLKELNKHRKQ